MTRWQYAWMTDQPATTIGFSHPQSGLAVELAGVLGPGVIIQQSTEWSISLDRMRVNLGYVSGLLGDRGWEMFAVETRLQPGAMSPAQLQTNWYFKREAPDGQGAMQAQAQSMHSTQPTFTSPTSPTSPAPGTSTPAAAPVAGPESSAPAFPPPPGPPGPTGG